MMLTGHEKALPLIFFYPQNEGKRTSPQVYVRDVIRRQQELNDLCYLTTILNKLKRYKRKNSIREWWRVRPTQWVIKYGISKRYTAKGSKKAVEEVERSIYDHRNVSGGTVLQIKHGSNSDMEKDD